MPREYNETVFSPEEVEKGFVKDLLKYLLDYNAKSDEDFYDIHVTSDGYCTIVQWATVPYNDEHYNGEFVFKDEDEVIMKELILPDNSIQYVHRGEEDEVLQEWLAEHPGWLKNEYGMWYREEDLIDWRKLAGGTISGGTIQEP